MTDQIQLAREVLELASKATPGPWYVGVAGHFGLVTFDGSDIRLVVGSIGGRQADNPDLGFCSHARTSAPALAQAVIEQEGRIALLERQLAELNACPSIKCPFEKKVADLERVNRMLVEALKLMHSHGYARELPCAGVGKCIVADALAEAEAVMKGEQKS